MNRNKVHSGLPKFELTFDSILNEFLKKLRIIVPFAKSSNVFTGLKDLRKDDKYVYIDGVIQKIFLKVDEEGTQVATVIVVKGNSHTKSIKPLPKIYPMNVDRPFLFLLRKKICLKIMN